MMTVHHHSHASSATNHTCVLWPACREVGKDFGNTPAGRAVLQASVFCMTSLGASSLLVCTPQAAFTQLLLHCSSLHAC